MNQEEGQPDLNEQEKEEEKSKDSTIFKLRCLNKILKDENYKEFYHELYPMQFEEPLFHIHLNVDYPFNLTGILYFPKFNPNVDL